MPNRKGYGKVGKRKAAFQLSHSHDYYEIPSVMGYGFKGQVQRYKSEASGKIRGMPQAAKDEIDKIRPYGGGNDGLWGLHKLDIIDKHRLLPTVGMKVGSWKVNLSLSPTEYNFAMPSILEEGDTIGWIPRNHETDKSMSVTTDIAFGEPEVFQGRLIIETLTQLTSMVKAIVAHFGV